MFSYVFEIKACLSSTNSCNNVDISDNDQNRVYPGETITIGLRALYLNGNPTYAQMFARLTKVRKWWCNNKRYSLTYDITYLLPIE